MGHRLLFPVPDFRDVGSGQAATWTGKLGQRSSPQGGHQEEGRADGAHNVGPDACRIHKAHPDGQLVLEQGAVLGLEEDLEVALGPPAALLEDVPHLQQSWVWSKRAPNSLAKSKGGVLTKAKGGQLQQHAHLALMERYQKPLWVK
jgi:hypothetical protein